MHTRTLMQHTRSRAHVCTRVLRASVCVFAPTPCCFLRALPCILAARAAESRSRAPASTSLSWEPWSTQRSGAAWLIQADRCSFPWMPRVPRERLGKGLVLKEAAHRFLLQRLVKPTENTVANGSGGQRTAGTPLGQTGSHPRSSKLGVEGTLWASGPRSHASPAGFRQAAGTLSPWGTPPRSPLCPSGSLERSALPQLFVGPRRPREGRAAGVCTVFLDASRS